MGGAAVWEYWGGGAHQYMGMGWGIIVVPLLASSSPPLGSANYPEDRINWKGMGGKLCLWAGCTVKSISVSFEVQKGSGIVWA